MKLLTTVFQVRYKSRTPPDPGSCRVLAVDWERKRLDVSNGRCIYFPSFDEVEEVPGADGMPKPGERWEHRENPAEWVTVTEVEGGAVYFTKSDGRTHLYTGKGNFTDNYTSSNSSK